MWFTHTPRYPTFFAPAGHKFWLHKLLYIIRWGERRERFVQKWEQQRKIGKQKYVLRYGVIYIGMSLTVLFSLADFLFNGTISIPYFIGRLFIFPTIGSILASQRWERMEKKYMMHQVFSENGKKEEELCCIFISCHCLFISLIN